VKTRLFLTFATVALLFALLFVAAPARPEAVSADGVTNYAGRIRMDTGTAHSLDWYSTAWSQESYGSFNIQVTQDVTDSGAVMVYTLYRSTDPVGCASVTNWAAAYDSLIVQNPAVAAGRYVSYTTQPTTTGAVTITYHYANVAAVAASVTRVDSLQTFSITGDGTANLQFDAGGAWCYKILGTQPRDISTVTTTITVSPFDIYF
jgi:hypothetical protein